MRVAHKQLKVSAWIKDRKSPFDRESIRKGCYTTDAVIAKVLPQFSGKMYCYDCHVGNGNFRTTFFPIGWTVDECLTYMNAQTKSGKSKAKLYLYGVGEVKTNG